MLLGDADVEGPRRKPGLHVVDAGAVRHGGGDGDDPRIGLGLAHQRLAEDRGIARRARLRFRLRTGRHVELGDAMILVGGLLRRRVALALDGHAVDQDRPGRPRPGSAQHRQRAGPSNGRRSGRYRRSRAPRRACPGSGHASHQTVRPARTGPERLRQGARESVGDFLQRGTAACRRRAATDISTSPRPAGRSTSRCR